MKSVLFLSTTKPATSFASGAGSLVKICPHTGSVLCNLRVAGDLQGRVQLGLDVLSLFPARFASPSNTLAAGYGSNMNKIDDSYVMLFTLRPASLPPVLHWKTRLPESRMSGGLLVSPCGLYVVCGGQSGSIYVWKSVGGQLLCTAKAHYGEVTVLQWVANGRQLATGGQDGVIHVFAMADLVDHNASSESIRPIRSWSNHLLPVTAIAPLDGGRIASAAKDAKIVLLEVFSEAVLAMLTMPFPIHSLVASTSRLFASCTGGSIFLVDMDQYAMQQTALTGATIIQRQYDGVISQVFSTPQSNFQHDEKTTENSYKLELKGHDRTVTALSVCADDDGQELLCSGDEAGVIRVWDMESRVCVRIIRPWSSGPSTPKTAGGAKSAATSTSSHPVSSMSVVHENISKDTEKSGLPLSGKSARDRSLVPHISPLQSFPSEDDGKIAIPFLTPKRTREGLEFWDVTREKFDYAQALRKLVKLETVSPQNRDTSSAKDRKRIRELESQLLDAQTTISRWENVSEKLTERLREHENN